MKRLCTFSGVAVFALALTSTASAQDGACCIPDPGDGSGETCVVTDQTDCETVQMGTFQGAGTDCSECSFENCVQSDEQCQEPNIPDFPGGTILTLAETADNFIPTADGTITSVCFWGAYIDGVNAVDCDDPLPGDSVTITFYPNIQSLPPRPDTTAGTPFVVTTLTRRATGLEFELANFDNTVSEYEWTATLPGGGFPVTAGECVWISIENTVTSGNPDCAWFWEVGPEAVNEPDTGQGDVLSWDVTTESDNDFDMAWCLNVGLGDTSDCFLPINPACEEPEIPAGEGSCVISNPDQNATPFCQVMTESNCAAIGGEFTLGASCLRSCALPAYTIPSSGGQQYAGCLDAECCTQVCDPDIGGLAICCSLGWDENCASVAVTELSCVGSPLCGGEVDLANCQPFSTGTVNRNATSFFFFASTTGATDGIGDAIAADDFSLGAAGSLSEVCWQGWGIDPAGNPLPVSFVNDFTITFYEDDNGLPGEVIATRNVGNGPSVINTNLTLTDPAFGDLGFPIYEYSATLDPPLDVLDTPDDPGTPDANVGECLWMSIDNAIGADTSVWAWQIAAESTAPPFYGGNGRLVVDGSPDTDGDGVPDAPPDGFDEFDQAGAYDFSFCFDLGPLESPACGLDNLYFTGPEEGICDGPGGIVDSCENAANPHLFLGYSSGCLDFDGDGDCLDDAFLQRRGAQPFTLPVPAAAGTEDWQIRQIYVDGFEDDPPVLNELMHFEIFARTGFERPTPEDSLVTGSVPFGLTETGNDHPQGGFLGTESGIFGEGSSGLYSIPVDLNLPPGDYWLTVWASNSQQDEGPTAAPSNFAWFANADADLNNLCPGTDCVPPTPEDQAAGTVGCNAANCPETEGDPFFWRARHWPDGAEGDPAPDDGFGFGSYTVANLVPDDSEGGDPDPDPLDSYNGAMFVRGNPGGGVCGDGVINGGEDCDDGNTQGGDGCSAICEAEPAPPCPWDCGDGDGTVGTPDFLALLGQWQDVGTSCDFDGGGVGTTDFLALLANWGDCPQ